MLFTFAWTRVQTHTMTKYIEAKINCKMDPKLCIRFSKTNQVCLTLLIDFEFEILWHMAQLI